MDRRFVLPGDCQFVLSHNVYLNGHPGRVGFRFVQVPGAARDVFEKTLTRAKLATLAQRGQVLYIPEGTRMTLEQWEAVEKMLDTTAWAVEKMLDTTAPTTKAQ